MAIMRSVLFYALVSSAVVFAQEYDPRKDFCRRFSHATAVVGERLYVDGGQLNLANRGGTNFTNEKLLFHDLTTTMVDGGEEIGMPPLISNLTKPNDVPSLVGSTLWPDVANAKLYQYGGETIGSDTPQDFTMWMYDIWEDKWSKTDPPADKVINRLAFGASTTVEYQTMGYYLGGWMGDKTTIEWVPNSERRASNKLLEYDMGRNEYTNSTGPEDGDGRAEGVMVYVPSGDNGMLVHFGGIRTSSGEENDAEGASMAEIDLYDLANQKWYVQNATGDVPEARRRFCGAVVSAEDNSSHEVYIYGGLTATDRWEAYDNVYVLSIPSFTWKRLLGKKGTEKSGHYDGSCNIINSSQMLVIGGIFPKDMEAKTCDVEGAAGVHNFDLAYNATKEAYWVSYVPELTGYKLPPILVKEIGGKSTGGATKTTPDDGWSSPDLETLFARTVDIPERKPTRTPPSPSSSDSSSSESKSSPNVVAIAVPTVLGSLALFGGLGIFLLWRRRQINAKSNGRLASDPAKVEMMPYSPTETLSPPYQTFSPQAQGHAELDDAHDGRYQYGPAPRYASPTGEVGVPVELAGDRGSPVETDGTRWEPSPDRDQMMMGAGVEMTERKR
ncbi:hypothetical protein EDC01DRAFT_679259 [Geopyxis carbonaria]|nr:hypothetical protein EDC01DRAFT_679259 [Geopyxis carbonaria]